MERNATCHVASSIFDHHIGHPNSLPVVLFWSFAMIFYGGSAALSSSHILEHHPGADHWQHLAAIRALILDLEDPANPYVASSAGTRHFHLLWVGLAALARLLDWSEWHVLQLAAYINMLVLALGIYSFARAYYPSAWGPLALLFAMVFGWSLPVGHTGFHSIPTLIIGAGYPATLLVGLSLLLWALVIRALSRPGLALWIAPLAAAMFAIHQLGAVIGFIGAACLILLWEGATWTARVCSAVALAAGVPLATLWPYYNPLDAMLRPGNSAWAGGEDFYGPTFLFGAFAPALLGLLGFRRSVAPRGGRAMLAVLAIYAVAAAAGAIGPQIGARFMMPAVLVLQAGLASQLITWASQRHLMGDRFRLTLVAAGVATVGLQSVGAGMAFANMLHQRQLVGSMFKAAADLTQDIPVGVPVAAHDVAAWPIVATGRRVVSIPWPEPLVHDLAARQQLTRQLFDANLPKHQRMAMARKAGVRTLIFDVRYLRSGRARRILEGQAASVRRSGAMVRLDLDLT